MAVKPSALREVPDSIKGDNEDQVRELLTSEVREVCMKHMRTGFKLVDSGISYRVGWRNVDEQEVVDVLQAESAIIHAVVSSRDALLKS